jgi:hypothetical protein
MAVGIIALRLGGVWLWLLWFAGALALVSLIYAFMDASAFGKVDGAHVHCTSRWLLWPYFLAVRGNALWHTRNSRTPTRLSGEVWFGALPTWKERPTFAGATIIDLTGEMAYEPIGNRYFQLPLLDLVAPSEQQLEVAVRAIDEAKNHGPVLVCCALGLSRSACVATAWLILHQRMSAGDATSQMRKLRPGVVLTREHLTVLGRFACHHGVG